MGFTPKSTVFKLVFEEDTPLHGLTVRARPCTIGEWNDMLSWSDEKHSSSSEVRAANDRVASLFLEHVESWDMEIPEGEPVPLTLEGWHKIDQNLAELLISAWQFAMMSIPKTSKSSSSGGDNLEEQQLDLEKLSESLPSWSPPSS